jgi:hypothetical protein
MDPVDVKPGGRQGSKYAKIWTLGATFGDVISILFVLHLVNSHLTFVTCLPRLPLAT